VGFTTMSAHTTPDALVALLNDLFTRFDSLATQHGVEKIKTIGDCYMAVSGVPVSRPDHAQAMAAMALGMLAELESFNKARGSTLRIRIGINSGPVVAGVIGKSKFIYDLWGDAVNTASRMESHGDPGSIHMTEVTASQLESAFVVEDRGVIHVKGKGDMRTFFLRSRKPPAPVPVP
jgi:class 3 adenylate cyclase